jgi:hypothetical protein
MVDNPHFDTYSIAARICLAIASLGGVLLIATAVTSLYFMH